MTKGQRRKVEAEREKAERGLDSIGSTVPMATEAGSARVVKRSLVVAGHRTSVSLENGFWRRLQRDRRGAGLSVNELAAEVDTLRGEANLSSALRVYVLEWVAPDAKTDEVS